MSRMRVLCTLLFCTVRVSFAQYETSTFERISLEHGLSQSIVYAIIQDRWGFMWFGTRDGLNKYDGYEFTTYRQGTTSLTDNQVRHIHEDNAGELWIATSNGLTRLSFDLDSTGNRNERFAHYKHNPDDPTTISDNDVTTTLRDRRGVVWVGTANGLSRMDSMEPPRFRRFKHNKSNPGSLSSNRVSTIAEDTTGRLWVGTVGGGLNLYLPATESFSHITAIQPRTDSAGASAIIMSLLADSRGKLWLGTYGGGLIIFDPQTNDVNKHEPLASGPGISDNRVYAIREARDGTYWIATFGGGLNRFDPITGTFTSYKNVPHDAASISSDFVRALHIDRADNLWAGTNDGLNKLDLKPVRFAHIRHDPLDKSSLSDKYVLSILEDSHGALWVGTNKGLDRIERGSVTHYAVDHRSARSSSGFVYALHEDRTGVLWLGTFGGGLYRADREIGRLHQFQHDAANPASLRDNRVSDIAEDHDGTLWVGTVLGLSRFDRSTGIFTNYSHDPSDDSSLSNNRVNTMLVDRKGTLWVGTSNGLNAVNTTTGRSVRYMHGDSALSHGRVNSIYEDAEGIIWVGTDNGLNRLDPSTGTTVSFYETNGLPNNFISAILGDDEGNLWISTNRGLSRFTPSANGGHFRNFDVRDGLQSNEFNTNAAFRGRSGELFFGGINGVTRLHPRRVRDNPTPPPVVLTALRSTGRITFSAMDMDPHIELGYNDRYIGFEFAALDFTAPQKNQYAYMLSGLNDRWILSGTRRYVSYTNLDPGKYTFQVKAANNDGVWNETGLSVNLTVLPPFYETWWFRVGVAVSLIAVLGMLYRYRVGKLLELERMRVRIASDLHDDVGSNLTKIALYSDLVAADGEQDPDRVRELVQKIGAMSREMVTTMSDIVWSIDARNDTLGDLVDRMRDFAAGALGPRGIRLTFDVNCGNTGRTLPVDIRQNLYLIFKEAINNAARHSAATDVQVALAETDGSLRLTIGDNGAGITEGGRRSGQGLRNMQMRALRTGSTLEISNRDGVQISLITHAF